MPRKKPTTLVGGTMTIGDNVRPIEANTAGMWEGAPVGVAAVLAPFADLAYPILPEPVITDEERDRMIKALDHLRDGAEEAVEVQLPNACSDVAALALALRVTAGRMGLPFGFYARPTPVPALIARRLR